MEWESEQGRNDHRGAASAGQHEGQLALTGGLEGLAISTRNYRHIVTHDNARAHYGDQHHHYYAKPDNGLGVWKDPMQQLLESLSFPQQNYRFATVEPAYRQTCQWLFETPEYIKWRNWDLRRIHNRILWLKGKPGTGKSTITKHALEHANVMYLGERTIFFFFNARGDKLEKCTEGMFRSLLYQIAQDVPSILQFIHAEAVEEYTSTGWPLNLLSCLFREAILCLASNVQVNCYIDALDEGDDEGQTREMVRFSEELAETAISKGVGFSIFFSSRHYPNITIAHSENIIVDSYEGHHADIASYVLNNLSCQPPALKAELVASIIERSSGIFLWVVLVVRHLNMESDRGNQHHLKESLQATPKGLDELFGCMVDVDSEAFLLPTLLWVLFAKRAMSPLELYLAVLHCANPGTASFVVWDITTFDETSVKNFITTKSRGLLEIVEFRGGPYIPIRPRGFASRLWIVQFIHESVREYLLGPGLRRLDPTLADNIIGRSNSCLARWCQSYLELSFQHVISRLDYKEVDEPLLILRNLLHVTPFSLYALMAIFQHSEEAAARGVDVQVPFEDYLHKYLPLSVACMSSSAPIFESQQTTLHDLARDGYTNLIVKLLLRYNKTTLKSYINLRVEGGSENQNAALHLAVRHRRLRVIQLLLENGADVNACNSQGQTTLLYAIEHGLTEMLQTVLNHGADVNARDRFGRMALHEAVKRRNVELIDRLLRHNADVNAVDAYEATPLLLAVPTVSQAQTSSTKVVDIILKHDANVNAVDRSSTTALRLAVESGNVEAIKMLLIYGADVYSQKEGHRSIMEIAHREYNNGIAQLLTHFADVHPRVRSESALTLEHQKWWKNYIRCGPRFGELSGSEDSD